MIQVKFKAGGFLVPGTLDFQDKIIIVKFSFNRALINEIKAMDGAKWNPDHKLWTVKNNGRNKFQLDYLTGKNPYVRYDLPLVTIKTIRPLFPHQAEMKAHGLTRHYAEFAAEMGTGKSLASIEVMEESGTDDWWYVGTKSSIRAFELELIKWKSKVKPKMMTYEALVKVIKNWEQGSKAPRGVIFDECSRVKTPTAQRSQAAFTLAEGIREDWGDDGYAILMSGSPAPKAPTDWWHQCEIACPGFLREGTFEKFKRRLAIIVQKQNMITGGIYPELVTWLDDERKCATCGKTKEEHFGVFDGKPPDHLYQASVNEISKLYKRLQGLVLVKFKKDCLNLPDKIYRRIELKPNKETLNALGLVMRSSSTVIKGLTLARELSDGFQYKEVPAGKKKCTKCKGLGECVEYDTLGKPFNTICDMCGGSKEIEAFDRTTIEIPTPKEQALIELLEENEDIGRICIYAGFTASIDRICKICEQYKWKTLRVDGRGWYHPTIDGNPLQVFQENKREENIALVAHPESGGMGLTLTAASMLVYWSNDFKAENRIQSEDRIHRPGMDLNRGATIVDLLHLPTDYLILENLQKKRDLQAMSMGEMKLQIDMVFGERNL